MFNVPIVHLPLSQFLHHHDAPHLPSMLQKTKTKGDALYPSSSFCYHEPKMTRGQCPSFLSYCYELETDKGVQLVNTMIRQQSNNAYCPRVLLPGCNKKHKNKSMCIHKQQEQQQNKRENIKGKKKLTFQ